MADGTHISWTDATWNVVTGCTKTSEGCLNCYIDRTPPFRMQHRRFDGPDVGATTGVTLHPDRLHVPLTWRKPRRVFVCSLADLFHHEVPDQFIAEVVSVMAEARQHTFQVLTKRPARMRALLSSVDFQRAVGIALVRRLGSDRSWRYDADRLAVPAVWPLRNVWVGVSAENQHWANIRVPLLLDTPAAVRWVSLEPLLGPIDIREWIDLHGSVSDQPGGSGTPSGARRRAGDSTRRDDLETFSATGKPLGWWDGADPMRAATSGAHGAGVPADPRDVSGAQVPRAGASPGVAALLRADPAGNDSEPQERDQDRQCADQSRTGDGGRAATACTDRATTWEARSIRDGERDGQAHEGAGTGDMYSPGQRGATDRHRGPVRGGHANDLEDCSRGATLSWVVVGGESGPGARPAHPDWFRSLRDQCQSAGVPFHFKQVGAWAAVADSGPEGWRARRVSDWHIRSDGYRWPLAEPHGAEDGTEVTVRRVGVKAAGRELDGQTWDQYPLAVT